MQHRIDMSDTSENTVLSSKEAICADPTAQEVDDAEKALLPQQAEHVEMAAQVQQPQVGADNTQTDIRRSQRVRVLTEKGKTLQDARLNNLKGSFEQKYRRWK